jgi:hypothetical protein
LGTHSSQNVSAGKGFPLPELMKVLTAARTAKTIIPDHQDFLF